MSTVYVLYSTHLVDSSNQPREQLMPLIDVAVHETGEMAGLLIDNILELL
jgi:hypothetical protein